MSKKVIIILVLAMLIVSCRIADEDGFYIWNTMRLPDKSLVVQSHEGYEYRGVFMYEGWLDFEIEPLISNPHDYEINVKISNKTQHDWVILPPHLSLDITAIL